jgi:hypothetical protein
MTATDTVNEKDQQAVADKENSASPHRPAVLPPT